MMTEQCDAPEGEDLYDKVMDRVNAHQIANDPRINGEEDDITPAMWSAGRRAVNGPAEMIRTAPSFEVASAQADRIPEAVWTAMERARSADRQGDATSPAPSGLVDAVRVALPISLVRDALQFVIDGRCDDDDAGTEALRDDVIQALDATLSGQQGGAVPAGDLRVAEARLDAWEKAHTLHCNCMAMLGDFNPLFVHRETGPEWLRLVKEAEAEVERARLAEQPAPARTGDADQVEGLRPGIEKALQIVETERETVSISSPTYQRLSSVYKALRDALDAASDQGEG